MSSSLLALGIIALFTTGLVFQYNRVVNEYMSEELYYQLQFNLWKQIENKAYEGAENNYRFAVFTQNFQAIKDHNARYESGELTFDLTLNSFADMTQEEFEARYLKLMLPVEGLGEDDQVFTGEGIKTSSDIDWVELGAVTHVKNQGQCGSCWAFSATGSLEGRLFQKNGKLVSLSEQELVSCAGGKYQNQGCNGGWMDNAFMYVIDNGITTEESYPYKGLFGGKCKENLQPRYQVDTFFDVAPGSQLALEAAITQQPVSVAINASGIFFQFYRTGVLKGHCSHKLNHGVLAVGLGTQNGHDYYKVKNSWGVIWGEGGYIKMARIGDGHGQCGINDAASFPV